MDQWKAAIVVLYLEGPGWHSYTQIAERIKQLGLVRTRAERFSQSVGMYLRERGAGHVQHSQGRKGMYRISTSPETKAWCERLIRNNPDFFRKRYPKYFQPTELPQPPAIPVRPREGSKRRQVDALLRCKVEKAAIEQTTAHYRKLGYKVDSYEKDNVGWDLFATCDSDQKRLEVKGLSGSEICVELTPNEYAQMLKWQDTYQVCVVTNALSDPHLSVFGFSAESGKWQDNQKRILQIQEKVAARCNIG